MKILIFHNLFQQKKTRILPQVHTLHIKYVQASRAHRLSPQPVEKTSYPSGR